MKELDEKYMKKYIKALKERNLKAIENIREMWATEKIAKLKAKNVTYTKIVRDDDGNVIGIYWGK
jgi:aspartyl/asparaginyl-tRNA synthetase